MRKCLSCGFEEEENSSYCRNCGKKIISNTSLDNEKIVKKEPPKTENKSLSGAITLFLVILLILIGILIGFIMNFLEG